LAKARRGKQSVVGETPNLAARLQALVEAGRGRDRRGHAPVWSAISSSNRDLGAVELKGIAAPVTAWQVLRPSGVASRFGALRGSAVTRLVGHDKEIELPAAALDARPGGDGQVMLVSGRTRPWQVPHHRGAGGALHNPTPHGTSRATFEGGMQ
jgi:hypothetical protein